MLKRLFIFVAVCAVGFALTAHAALDNDTVFRMVPLKEKSAAKAAPTPKPAPVPAEGMKLASRTLPDDLQKPTQAEEKTPNRLQADVLPDYLKVLSESDVKVYKKLFALQRAKKRWAVVKRLDELDDKKILMGHLIAERLLHPNTKAPYEDLKSWMARYNDHARAKTIYQLANMRRPRGETHNQPAANQAGMGQYTSNEVRTTTGQKVKRTRQRSRTLYKLKRYRIRGQYDKSMNILAKSDTPALLGEDTYYQVSLKLARHMLNKGVYDKAEKVADNVVRASSLPQPEGLWISGSASYKLENYEVAAGTFRRLVYTVPPKSRYYARAAWWASRAYERLDRESMSRVFLSMATHDPESFYGLLAAQKMDKVPDLDWMKPVAAREDVEKLLKDPSIRRVVALAQIGEHGLAQQELRVAYERIPYNMDDTLLAMSMALDLPGTSLTLAMNLRERNKMYFSGLYPYSKSWEPKGGFKLDQALLFAIMRQESAFKPEVKSYAGARGLMQLMPGTARHVRYMQNKRPHAIHQLYDPKVNVQLGQTYMKHLEEEFDGNLVHMIAAYNAGPGNVRKWMKRFGDFSDDPILFVESIPFEETRKYVMRVMGNLWMYRTYFYNKTPTLEAMARNQWPNNQMAMLLVKDIDG